MCDRFWRGDRAPHHAHCRGVIEGISRPHLEADENAFSDRLPAFLMSMGAPEIGCIGGAEVLPHGMAQDPSARVPEVPAQR